MIWQIDHGMLMRILRSPVQSTSILTPERTPRGPTKGAARPDVEAAQLQGCGHSSLCELVPRPTNRVSGRSSQDPEADLNALLPVRLDQRVFVTACAYSRDRGRGALV